jgi:ketosteroid isomerase-like protein
MKLRYLEVIYMFLLAAVLLGAAHLHSGVVVAADSEPEAQIRAVLSEQQAAWNRADIAAFMKGYWSSPELTFAGSGGVTRGWQPVLERYRERYRDAQAMGHLDFSELEVHLLGNDAAFVLGRWHLKREKDEPGGVFTLVFQRFPEGWRIVHDHTSADEPRK